MKHRAGGTIALLLASALCCLMISGCNSCAAIGSLNEGDEPMDVLAALGTDVFGAHAQSVSKLQPALPRSSAYTPTHYKAGYEALYTDAQKKAYEAMENAIFRFTNEGGGENGRCQMERAYIPRLSSAEIYMVKEAVMADHPEAFWITKAYSLEYNFKEGDYIILYSSYSYDEAMKRLRALENAVGVYLSDMPVGLKDYEKEKYIHDRLVTECDYDVSVAEKQQVNSEASGAYGALVNHRAVCGGYVCAMKLLMDRVGIASIPVRGTSEEIGHVWLMVNIDNSWYHLDPTWDDPVATEPSLSIHYDYFNLTDEMICEDHELAENYSALTEELIRSGEAGSSFYNFTLPPATSTVRNFYEQEAIKVDDLSDASAKTLAEKLTAAVRNGKNELSIKFSDDVTPEAAKSWLTGDNGCLMESVKASNRENEKKIVEYVITSHTREDSLPHMQRIYTIRLTFEAKSEQPPEATSEQ